MSPRLPNLAAQKWHQAKRGSIAALLVCAYGCASVPAPPSFAKDADVHDCLQMFAASDKRIADAGRRDAQSQPIAGFPFLRNDRVLASLVEHANNAEQIDAWLARVAELDQTARTFELANQAQPGQPGANEKLNACRVKLQRAVAADSAAWQHLRRQAQRTPDAYVTWQRALGLYPLSARLVLVGVMRLHRTALVAPNLPAAPNALHYAFPDMTATSTKMQFVLRDALGVPHLSRPQELALLARFAPAFSVATDTRADRIGRVTFDPTGAQAEIDTARPTLYTAVNFTRYGDETYVQLIYSVWFSARPRDGPFDLLGGDLDAVTWLVTLDRDGEPLLYDAMHNCGCYHMFFPTPRLSLRPATNALEEPLWVPFVIPPHWGHHLTIHLESKTHFITSIGPSAAQAPDHALALAERDGLRSISNPTGGRRSLYDERGLVGAGARRERFLLWPMGVPSAGAMRQWGHHATAFVGRRHFDEAFLIERYFEYRRSVQ